MTPQAKPVLKWWQIALIALATFVLLPIGRDMLDEFLRHWMGVTRRDHN